ncbi:MAG: hypothetical protein JOZ78_13455 [Chroococcidiopsidaceae cyanobacterium CP_BM_ER_R8_30]|nr:hypothetical protein [Chroococcidiopsidaceae cyanobacterium CP_BM_ER_R8_30]
MRRGLLATQLVVREAVGARLQPPLRPPLWGVGIFLSTLQMLHLKGT